MFGRLHASDVTSNPEEHAGIHVCRTGVSYSSLDSIIL
jgi:hypothetical protein